MTLSQGNTIQILDATLFTLLLFLVAWFIMCHCFGAHKLPYPPGPPALPFIGNLLDMPKDFAWIQWANHRALYGPISHVEVFGRHIVLLNETNAAVELMERQSIIYSDRPRLVFSGEMVGLNGSLLYTNLSAKFRRHRKNLHQVIGTKANLSKFYPMLIKEARRLASRLRVSETEGSEDTVGEGLHEQIRTTVAAIAISISHGYTIEVGPAGQDSDPLVKLADNGMRAFSESAAPGKWLVDLLPFLRYVPSWPYEPAFKREARGWRRLVRDVVELPHAFVKFKMSTGQYIPSVASTLLQEGPTSEEEEIIKWTTNAIYGAGTDTTAVTIYCFFLAMTLFPDVQRKAQEELDTVVGPLRLPTMEDRASLPYVEAVVMEILRWAPIVPMGFPHVAAEEGTCRGYHIPKGALLLANTWLYTRDLSNYHDPEEFKPERFLISNPEKDPRGFVFGFGRRICPGRELAETAVFISIATILATYDISKALDARGEPIQPRIQFSDGIVSQLNNFPCKVTPRRGSEKLFKLIDSEEDMAVKQSQFVSDREILQKLMDSRPWDM